ncbi:hypothetical protein ACH5RR_035709 [Cinchona calisaya]|uniref:TPX2 C-terminal domain-containing protein n=1 Tax=Cinchona calisaya TaxID=153742 RepID=A0ABD2Y396_9GENT
MGESIVERPTFEKKMGEPAPSAASLQVSVSFGRFESDSLSWEKWSSFSPNKYLEEVEKCSTPGSVAQKKAYFEAHYKRIAARKTEQLEQEKLLMESVPPSSDDPASKGPPVKNTSVVNVELGISGSGRSAEEVEPDVAETHVFDSTKVEEEKEQAAIAVDCQGLEVEETEEQLNGTSANPESNDVVTGEEELISNQAELELSGGEDAMVVQEDNAQKNSSLEIVEQPLKGGHEAKKTPLSKSKSPKLRPGSTTQKMTPSRKEQALASSKKEALSPAARPSTVTKLSQLSTPRLSKSTMMPASLSSTKKVNGSSAPVTKNTSGGNRIPMPTSLHMSLSLDPANSGLSLPTTRKSLIMESMGDKDIVRRAFKTFQNSINGLKSPSNGLLSASQQVSYKGPEKKVSTTLTPRKENEGPTKSAEKIMQRGRSGYTSNSVSSWPVKGSGVDKKGVTAVSSSTSVRNGARDEKWKEKPGEKSFVREVERPHFSSKIKEEDSHMKNVRPGLKSKTSPGTGFNRGQGITKIPSEKEEKSKVHHRPMSKR